MCRIVPFVWLIVTLAAGFTGGCSQDTPRPAEVGRVVRDTAPQSGEVLFKQFCSSCHPNGGNVSDPDRPLYGSALKRNRITTPEDVVRIMRNPVSRMIRFDAATLSDRDARTIAEYILVTFK